MFNLFKKKTNIFLSICFIVFIGSFIIISVKYSLKKTNSPINNVIKKSLVSNSKSTGNSQIKDTNTSNNNTHNTTSKSNVPDNNVNKATNTSITLPQKQQIPVVQDKHTVAPTQQKTVPKLVVQPQATVSPQKYISKNLGFSLVFPASWQGKYNIVEDSNELIVYFKPVSHTVNVPGEGLLFKIVNKATNVNEASIDSIPGAQRYFTTKGITFVIGSNTDVDFPDDNPEFNNFLQLSKDSPSVINTITSLN